MRHRKIISRRLNYQPKKKQKKPQPTKENSEPEPGEEPICEPHIKDTDVQHLEEIIKKQQLKLKESEAEISSLKRSLEVSTRNKRITKIKHDKQTLMNSKLNEKLKNASKIVHDHLFLSLSLDNPAKVKFYTGLPPNGNLSACF